MKAMKFKVLYLGLGILFLLVVKKAKGDKSFAGKITNSTEVNLYRSNYRNISYHEKNSGTNPCNPNPCKYNQPCVVRGNIFKCNCNFKLRGDMCEIGPCEQRNYCRNGGECYLDDRFNRKCKCAPGYGGDFCMRISCDNVCQNGGTCKIEENDIVTCKCPPLYRGQYCQNEPGTCASYPCQNGGTCKEEKGAFNCTCPVQFTGSRCELEDPCTNNPCQNGGLCTFKGDEITCSCMSSFFGDNCEKDPCTNNPCQNNGFCTFEKGKIECTCLSPFSGEYCEKDPCTNNLCQNGGLCTLVGDEIKCNCMSPFFGDKCEKGPCTNNPCSNGGTCVVIQEKNKCNCKSPYFGDICEADPCTSNPCKNGGICYIDGNRFNCLCQNPYFGISCEADPCTSNPCKNEGVCEVIESTFNCSCKSPYFGDSCEKESITTKITTPATSESTTHFLTTKEILEVSTTRNVTNFTDITSRKPSNFTEEKEDFLFSTTTYESSSQNSSTEPQQSLGSTDTVSSSSVSGCDCGKHSVSCKYNNNGEKKCECVRGFSQLLDNCADCTCGSYATGCYFDEDQKKICTCENGFHQINGVCSAECNLGLCVHGKCESFDESYVCRCFEGYTGSHCETKVTMLQGFWILMVMIGISTITLVLVTAILCRLRRRS